MSYTVLWLIWIGFFVAVEGAALSEKGGKDTLSEHVWAWAAVKGKPKGWQARRAMLIAFLAWLCFHLISGGWT